MAGPEDTRVRDMFDSKGTTVTDTAALFDKFLKQQTGASAQNYYHSLFTGKIKAVGGMLSAANSNKDSGSGSQGSTFSRLAKMLNRGQAKIRIDPVTKHFQANSISISQDTLITLKALTGTIKTLVRHGYDSTKVQHNQNNLLREFIKNSQYNWHRLINDVESKKPTGRGSGLLGGLALGAFASKGKSLIGKVMAGVGLLFLRPFKALAKIIRGTKIAKALSGSKAVAALKNNKALSWIATKMGASLGKTVGAIGKIGGGIFKAGKLLGKAFWPITLLLSALDAAKGWKNAGKLLNKQTANLKVQDRLAAATGKVINGITFSIGNMVAKTMGFDNVAQILDRFVNNAWISSIVSGAKDLVSNIVDWVKKHVFNLKNQGADNPNSPKQGNPTRGTYHKPLVTNGLAAIRQLESSGPKSVSKGFFPGSKGGAVGTYQITPETADTYGLDRNRLSEPGYNKYAASKIYGKLSSDFHDDTELVLIAWNAGPGKARQFLRSGRNYNMLPMETINYLYKFYQQHPNKSMPKALADAYNKKVLPWLKHQRGQTVAHLKKKTAPSYTKSPFKGHPSDGLGEYGLPNKGGINESTGFRDMWDLYDETGTPELKTVSQSTIKQLISKVPQHQTTKSSTDTLLTKIHKAVTEQTDKATKAQTKKPQETEAARSTKTLMLDIPSVHDFPLLGLLTSTIFA